MKMFAYYVCCIYSNALQKNLTLEANTMYPDQTAPFGQKLRFIARYLRYSNYGSRTTWSSYNVFVNIPELLKTRSRCETLAPCKVVGENS